MKKDLLLEIGTEEIPAKFMPGTLNQLKELAEKTLQAERLNYESLETLGTPRRLALCVYGLDAQQGDLLEEVKGPAKKAAFNAEGQPTKAAEGFARGQGVAVSELSIKDTGAGEYVFALKKQTGRPTGELLPEIFNKLLHSLNFPKPMRWGDLDFRFARPIRWLVALFGEDVVDWEFTGLKAGRISYGHRSLAQAPVEISQPLEYREKLRSAYVVVDQQERKNNIWEQIQAAAKSCGGVVEENEELLTEVVYLVEYPTALVGSFEEEYLELPKEVVITPMREHQRYFPVYDGKGKLLNKFITVRNGTAEHIEVVRAGNEKVLRARLADARFYYEQDLAVPLADLVPRLGKIVFHEKLGTVLDKVERARKLGAAIGSSLGLNQTELADLDRALLLAKADLVTLMVYDFPELQGIMGAEYAGKSGEKNIVAQAIAEHYQPRFAGDELPQSSIGRVAAIADKLDSIVGAFAIGIQPTGSQDPYALRRQALGITNILLESGYKLSVSDLVAQAFANFNGNPAVTPDLVGLQAQLADFFQQRLRNVLSDWGYRYDLIDAVLAAGVDDMVDGAARARALALFRERDEFSGYLQAFTRANNLAKKAESVRVYEPYLQEPAERELYEALSRVAPVVSEASRTGDYSTALQGTAELTLPIEQFFTQLMVMVEDDKVRNNRLGLLKQCADLMACAGDLSKLVD